MRLVLVGAGGHAKAVVEAIRAAEFEIAAYVDPNACPWLEDVEHVASDEASASIEADAFVLGLGAVSPDGLERRLELLRRYKVRGWEAPSVIHGAAWVSEDALIADAAIVLAGAVVQPGAEVGEAAMVNSGAIVEHDSVVGSGAHVAPGAILLGDAQVGACAMIGAGAVVLPGAEVPANTLVPALTRFAG